MDDHLFMVKFICGLLLSCAAPEGEGSSVYLRLSPPVAQRLSIILEIDGVNLEDILLLLLQARVCLLYRGDIQ